MTTWHYDVDVGTLVGSVDVNEDEDALTVAMARELERSFDTLATSTWSLHEVTDD